MSIAGNLTKLRANIGILGIFLILPVILLLVLVAKIFSALYSKIGWRTLKNVADEVAVVSDI